RDCYRFTAHSGNLGNTPAVSYRLFKIKSRSIGHDHLHTVRGNLLPAIPGDLDRAENLGRWTGSRRVNCKEREHTEQGNCSEENPSAAHSAQKRCGPGCREYRGGRLVARNGSYGSQSTGIRVALQSLQVGTQFGGVLIPLFAVFLQRLVDDLLEP